MTKTEIYTATKAWLEAALPELGARVIQARTKERPRGRPAADVPRPAQPYATMLITGSRSLAATAYERTTDIHVGAPAAPPAPAENLYRHEIHRRRFCTMHLELFGQDSFDRAELLIDSRLIPAIRAQLRAAAIWAFPISDPLDVSEQTATAWDERAAIDFRIHYLLTTITASPIIESNEVNLQTWTDGQDPETDPPAHDEDFTIP